MNATFTVSRNYIHELRNTEITGIRLKTANKQIRHMFI